MTYAYDFNRVPGPSADEVKAAEGDGVLIYGTGQQQSAEYVKSIEDAGLHVARIWEHNTDSILGGYAYGVAECVQFERDNPPGMVYVACDLNNGALGGRDVTPFLQGWASITREPKFGIYGPQDAILQGQASGLAKLDHYWGVVNWISGGRPNNDPWNIAYWTSLGVDLIQLIGSPIDATDANQVLKASWWTTGTADSSEDDDVNNYITKKSNPNVGIWVTNNIHRRWVLPDEWAFLVALSNFLGKPVPSVLGVSDQWWDSLPDASKVGTGSAGPVINTVHVSGTFDGVGTPQT